MGTSASSGYSTTKPDRNGPSKLRRCLASSAPYHGLIGSPSKSKRNPQGFIRTGAAVAQSPQWTRQRAPFLLETSRAGIFAAGDVRLDSVKRVASAVGEGAMAVQFVHEYLKEM